MTGADHDRKQPFNEADGSRASFAKIAAVGARGDGIAQTNDGPVFIPFTLPGEHVTYALIGDRAGLVTVERASPERTVPVCTHFGQCGGCTLQHWESEAYQRWKRGVIEEALERAHIDAPVGALIDATGAGRRRATFHGVKAKAVGFAFGFSKRASNHVFDLRQCPVLEPALAEQIPALKELANMCLPKPGRVDVHVNMTDTGPDLDVRGGAATVDPGFIQDLAALAERQNWARITLKDEPLLQRVVPMVTAGTVGVTPPPGAFMQATAAGEKTLAKLVIEACAGAGRVFDLYAGWGAFALRLAAKAEVRAVEGDAATVEALRTGAKHTAGLKPVTAFARDLARNALGWRELNWADAVVLDPPRAGAVRQIAHLASSKVGRIAYVSCNPATFARDARTLIDAGFRLESVTPVDQFLYSAHVELVGVFTR